MPAMGGSPAGTRLNQADSMSGTSPQLPAWGRRGFLR
jgi:hypothetical protein